MGLNRLGIGAHQAQFGSQALDVAVDGALVTHVRGHAKGIEQLLAAEHPLRLFQQTLQQAELMAGERQRLPTVSDQHAQGIELEQCRFGHRFDTWRHAFEDCPNPGSHSRGLKGLTT
ncbi:hypothetical protein PspTeo4_38144 [Pseudomonas sp. Teo4]|nr:hypothetical protein [Pseudomonas sp. Teo4]